jgi:hypothetical protein
MSINATTKLTNLQRSSSAVTGIQATLIAVLLGFGIPLLLVTISVGLLNTVLIFVAVTGVGFWLCHHTHTNLVDSKLKILGTFWLIKVIVTLFLLFAGWVPELDPSSMNWGYDPQRYYQDAWTLVEEGWNPSIGSNYQGIIFFYGVIFYLFGYNPVIPALINAFITLLGTLFIIRCAYSFVSGRTSKDWTLAGLLLVPEVLWYDVMTSRESLMAVLISVAILAAGRYLVGVKFVSLSRTLLLAGTALLAILTVRTSMAIPVVCSIAGMMILMPIKRKIGTLGKVLVLCFIIAVASVGEFIQQETGGHQSFSYIESIEYGLTFQSNVAALNQWSNNSIGLLIAPNNVWQSVLYLPPRMVLYLAAPLPNVAVSIPALINGSWGAWQGLMTILTSVMMLLGLPYALAGASQCWTLRRQQPAFMVLHIAFWATFIAVAGGNIIIHERYRVMFTLLLFACVWFGYTRSTGSEVLRWARPWFRLLGISAAFYAGYKFFT